MSLKSKALSLVARKEYARQDLYNKLLNYCTDIAEIDLLLDEFEELGYISDARYGELFIDSRKHKYGKRRLMYELTRKGVDLKLMGKQLREIDFTSQLKLAGELVKKRYGNRLEIKDLAKVERFLQYRGFELDVIHKILNKYCGK